MLTIEDITIAFKGDLDISYKEDLERLFFFNQKQHIYKERINQSIEEFSMPILKEMGNRVSIVFEEEWRGQTLHILDSDEPGSELIGVVMYSRVCEEMITIIHFVLHEGCNSIFKQSNINIVLIVFQELITVFKRMKGVNKVCVYYIDKVINI